MDRREFLMAAGTSVVTFVARAEKMAGDPQTVRRELASVKACVFDVFGTVVDWRSSVIAEATNWGASKGLSVDWAEFTDSWRLGYRPAMDKVRSGEIPWTNLDDLHRLILEDLLKQYEIEGLSEDEKLN